MSKIEKPVCPVCGSDDVLADAYAEWSVDDQRWYVQNVFDKGAVCNACEAEVNRLKWVTLTDEQVEDLAEEQQVQRLHSGE